MMGAQKGSGAPRLTTTSKCECATLCPPQANREIKRASNGAMGPLLSNVQEALHGRCLARAMGLESFFISRHDRLVRPVRFRGPLALASTKKTSFWGPKKLSALSKLI